MNSAGGQKIRIAIREFCLWWPLKCERLRSLDGAALSFPLNAAAFLQFQTYQVSSFFYLAFLKTVPKT